MNKQDITQWLEAGGGLKAAKCLYDLLCEDTGLYHHDRKGSIHVLRALRHIGIVWHDVMSSPADSQEEIRKLEDHHTLALTVLDLQARLTKVEGDIAVLGARADDL